MIFVQTFNYVDGTNNLTIVDELNGSATLLTMNAVAAGETLTIALPNLKPTTFCVAVGGEASDTTSSFSICGPAQNTQDNCTTVSSGGSGFLRLPSVAMSTAVDVVAISNDNPQYTGLPAAARRTLLSLRHRSYPASRRHTINSEPSILPT